VVYKRKLVLNAYQKILAEAIDETKRQTIQGIYTKEVGGKTKDLCKRNSDRFWI